LKLAGQVERDGGDDSGVCSEFAVGLVNDSVVAVEGKVEEYVEDKGFDDARGGKEEGEA
jgi:hypothetical protein